MGSFLLAKPLAMVQAVLANWAWEGLRANRSRQGSSMKRLNDINARPTATMGLPLSLLHTVELHLSQCLHRRCNMNGQSERKRPCKRPCKCPCTVNWKAEAGILLVRTGLTGLSPGKANKTE